MDKKNPEAKKKPVPKKPATFLTLDNTNILGCLLSCFIVCGCMFFLGVLVGRNTAPVQFDVDRIEEKLANLQVSVLNQKNVGKTEDLKPDTPNTPNNNSMTELLIVHEDIIDQLKDRGKTPEIYEQYVPPVLTPKYAKTPPARQKPEPVKKTPCPEPKKQVVKSEPDIKPASVAEPKPEVRSAPAEAPAPVVKPEITAPQKSEPETDKSVRKIPKPAAQGFVIQVASLKDPEKAKMLMNKFKEKGYPAFCQRSEVNGATWHRVRIGPYPDRVLADKDRNRLKAAGVDSLIISMN